MSGEQTVVVEPTDVSGPRGTLRLEVEGRTVAGPYPLLGTIERGAPAGVAGYEAPIDADRRRFVLDADGRPMRLRSQPDIPGPGWILRFRRNRTEDVGAGERGTPTLFLAEDDLEGLEEAAAASAGDDRKQEFLERLGAQDASHSGENLMSHLMGTSALLRDWGARPAVCDAGLFHTVYGTESYRHPTLTPALRRNVRELIGREAEELVYLNHAKDTSRFLGELVAWSPDRDAPPVLHSRFVDQRFVCAASTTLDLVDLTLANAFEQVARVPEHYGPEHHELFRTLIGLTGRPGARRTFDALFGDD